MEKNLTTGSVLKNILFFSLPYLFSYFLQTLYGMADLFIIGQFEGVAATTAVSIGSQVMHMLTVMIVGLAMGTTVSIAQAIGANKKDDAAAATGNTVTLFLILSVCLTGALLCVIRPITMIMSVPEEAVSGTIAYLTICFIGIPFITAYNIISSIFRGMGDSKSPMYFIAVACVANIILDYIFIGLCHFGPAGAALGTTVSQAISVIVSLFVIVKRKTGISLKPSDFRPKRNVCGTILKIGIPIACQDGLIQIAFIIITIIANSRGVDIAAAVGVVEKIISFLFLVPSSMLSAISAICAQCVGTKQHQRARQTLRYGCFIALGFGIFFALTCQFISKEILSLFTSEAAVIMYGSQYLKGYVLDCVFASIHFCFSGFFTAYGYSMISFIHNVISIVLIRVPGAYITSKLFPDTLLPMGLTPALGSILSAIICVSIFIIMKKKINLIIKTSSK